jgi:hypothetical protein
MTLDTAEVYRAITRAFVSNDRKVLAELIAPDVIWHTDHHQSDVPNEFHGLDAFFAVIDGAQQMFKEWEVIPHAVLGNDRICFSHQVDRFVFPDGSTSEIRFNLYMEFNEVGQLQQAWEFGQSQLGQPNKSAS